MALRAGGLIAALCVLAGCGGGGARTATETPEPKVPTSDLSARAKACGLPAPAPVKAPADLVALLPQPSQVTALQPAGAGFRAVAFIPRPIGEALVEMKRLSAARGLEEFYSEREPFDAELNVRGADGIVYAIKLTAVSRCDDSSTATVIRLQG